MGFNDRLVDDGLHGPGFSSSRELDEVCEHCIDDEALARVLSRYGRIERCAFCGRSDVQGATVGQLFKYMAACIAVEYNDPNNEVSWSSAEGGWVGADVLDSDDLLIELDGPLSHEDLHLEFLQAFGCQWCQRNPYRFEHAEMLKLSWDRFAGLIRTRHRYLFLARTRIDEDDELLSPAEMLEAVAKAIHNAPERMLKLMPAGSRVVRARAHPPGDRFTSAAQLGSPPPEYAGANRMSPPGISMFYAAEDAELAVAEIRPAPGSAVTCGTWALAHDLWFLDLTQARPIPSLFDHVQRPTRTWLRFLAHFAEELSKPAAKRTAEVDYVPTQVVTEYVRDVLTATRAGEAIRGIIYASALDPTKRCWVVFAEPKQCGDAQHVEDHHLLILDPGSVHTALDTYGTIS